MSAHVGRTAAIALWGLAGTPVQIEASVNSGLPGIDIVGLPDTSVSESRKRIRAAISNLGITLPAQRITVNLSPGSVKKVGTAFDLGIATAILAAAGHLPTGAGAGLVFVGELGLDGRLHPVRGVMPCALAAVRAGFGGCAVPAANSAEARLVPGLKVLGAGNLAEALNALGGQVAVPALPPVSSPPSAAASRPATGDLREVRGHGDARRALEVAAAGGHHLLMIGSPGAGKTLLAGCLPSLLPRLSDVEAVEALALRSIDGTLDAAAAEPERQPPFEAPHHRTSAAAMVGGSRPGTIGVFSRAHRGVLFMDEAPEFHRDVLEALRQPLESGRCDIHRAWGSVSLPARFQLVLAANPCPCGASMGPQGACSCSPMDRRRYRGRLSGPLLDRVDIQLDMLPIAPADLHSGQPSEDSASVARRVARARERQAERFAGQSWALNAQAPGSWLRESFALSRAQTQPLDRALERGSLTMRGYDRIVRIAATIADLDDRSAPDGDDLLAALVLRTREAA
ncbi:MULTISPECIES: YifB family Mg chelatase-like AAA ATPase [Brevibacterium]|uniref:YifB family Mg chelatase-like AAA ATPase n=1 Tax=Brevibacterium TaxID=1696 RepID=UPI002282D003|nr:MULTISPECIES: YifB family Mg chelatase-like AAA ATPase [Brevibacterium]WAL41281.1 YifB family Mg chelatase-like AAA ATPase [Brevibacterium sp. BRM-1]